MRLRSNFCYYQIHSDTAPHRPVNSDPWPLQVCYEPRLRAVQSLSGPKTLHALGRALRSSFLKFFKVQSGLHFENREIRRGLSLRLLQHVIVLGLPLLHIRTHLRAEQP